MFYSPFLEAFSMGNLEFEMHPSSILNHKHEGQDLMFVKLTG